ncbi:Thaumatin family - like 10 [Theobroma cacao]|uniref:Thaumatin-like protein 1b n=1 Tax=Theobroma cacao TaxID=3641 RepID=A0AB32V304_THECC|nr:PREDICTED: thaumatin-like protein 1b [Theobroma cacao]WRX23498.1 Thaumatin family - like 10 [Theobroma cacao]
MMRLYLLFGLSLALLMSGAHMATLNIRNNCPYTIWPGTLTGGGGAQLPNTGFELAPQASNSINVPAPWTGRLWARTQCSTSSGSFSCATANCGSGQVACNGAGAVPPASLVEFTLAANGGQDFYDVSLVDGFNLPVSITPQGGSGPTCTTTSCAANVNSVCPSELAVRGSDGNIIACKSACVAFNQPQYCCTGDFDSPETCQPSNYSRIFKGQCPQAYSYAYDDPSSTFSCTGGPNYLITFCP